MVWKPTQCRASKVLSPAQRWPIEVVTTRPSPNLAHQTIGSCISVPPNFSDEKELSRTSMWSAEPRMRW